MKGKNESKHTPEQLAEIWVFEHAHDAFGLSVQEGFIAGYNASALDLLEENEKLGAFKSYVHKRLDDAGIPIDPESPHKEAGCRIGGRLDIALSLQAEVDRLKNDLLDALDLKEGNGPTALTMLSNEVDRLTKEKKELVDALQICLSVKSHKTSIEAMKELIRALLTRIK